MICKWKKIVKHSLPLLSLCILIEIFAGQQLQGRQDTLVLFPIFLISIPVINGVAGNVGSVLGARLASGLHVGYIHPSIKDKEIRENVLTSIFIGIITYVFLAILIYYIAVLGDIQLEDDINLINFIFVISSVGVILICLVSMISVFTAFWAFKKGLDPDDIIAPVVTTVGDVFGIVFLFFLIGAVGI